MNRRNALTSTALAGAAVLATTASSQGLAQSASGVASASGSTLERVRKSGVLRIAAIVGQAPYFNKDLLTGKWTGACMDMANDIGAKLGAKVGVVETTWGNQILDLQADKIDLAFAVNPTPERALVIDFASPILMHSFTAVTRKGFPKPATWEDLSKPTVRIAVDLGSTHELIARRYAPKANIVGFKNRDEAVLAVATGRADCNVVLAILALPMLKKNPALGEIAIPRPRLTLPSNLGVRIDPDRRFRDFLSVWTDYNRSIGQTREWLLKGLAEINVTVADIPAEVQF
ncbi:ABC transporter substrate-binding protein [Verminephrobacter aporrectodeae subsp. tuberculatae]|uniref:transporter substrate-binding domain-containing protein n=1 Tax=Verminephrobacter aporrectodeae TaxID=1110389 RepID=UPI002238F341|nr:transporter substrate-binding domain-containing protein [Verminephrobacter aporrectodeae]MCW5221072.1 ABC transporter substrate-binding protein [Verminephrobacter aporrectodeae subsp. tuberculatae]MCW5254827.1 ABC transporter substrate-binding protein [Verminephrobacter aporrectodeae subsp. tuberculatae]MCW5290365.1 ABC transporter substrate-binding protein [Verminephrobacter aporrectodeae subsp. tuberculatae]MCW8205519.1 ABC transporter substrate-binding protein [Verminephrobacter aporrecto